MIPEVRFLNLAIANRLVALRRERGLTQEGLAAALGVSRQAVSKWERAEASPDTDNLLALSQLYGISLDDLLSPEGGTPESRERESVLAAAEAWERAEATQSRSRREQWKRRLRAFPYAACLPFFYLVLGFAFHLWHPGWMIFLTVPIYYALVEFL